MSIGCSYESIYRQEEMAKRLDGERWFIMSLLNNLSYAACLRWMDHSRLHLLYHAPDERDSLIPVWAEGSNRRQNIARTLTM